MNIGRRDFLKAICGGFAFSPLTAVPDVSKKTYENLEFIYDGHCGKLDEHQVNSICFSNPLDYQGIVRCVALELWRFNSYSQVNTLNYYHDIDVYENGCGVGIIHIGVNKCIYEYSQEDSELVVRLKYDISRELDNIKERTGER